MYFSFFFLNADSLCITLCVICLYMKTHMYFVRVGLSTCVWVLSLDGLNKEFCSVMCCSVLMEMLCCDQFKT